MAVKIDLAKKTVALGVGDLVAEPLTSVGRVAGLSIWARMEMGRETHVEHQRAQAERHPGYGREIFVRHITVVDGFTVTIQGRIDGVCPGPPPVIEEIKSVVVPPLVFAALRAGSYPHYLEQVRLYCFLVERNGAAPDTAADRGDAVPPTTADDGRGEGPRPRGLMRAAANGGERQAGCLSHEGEGRQDTCPRETGKMPVLQGRLVFINLADGGRKEIEVAGPFDDCAALIAQRVRALIGLATADQRQREARRRLADELVFPHPAPRKYQDQMIAAVERALAAGRHLLVSAPSGIGKTAGALWPVLRQAYAGDRRVFFVTAKNTQHQNAVETLRRMAVPTAVVFRAREKMCINSVYACREEFCPHLQDVLDKLDTSRAVEHLLEQRLITPEGLIAAGRGSSLCPFDLGLLAAERAEVIVGDYNYVFDPQVYFRRFFQDNDYGDIDLIIDEAHNLVGRAMEYYSPSLRRRQIRDLAPALRRVEPALAREFKRVLGLLNELFETLRRQHGDEYSQADEAPGGDGGKFLIESPQGYFAELKPAVNRLAVRYVLDKIGSGRAVADDPVEQFFADFGQFSAVLALGGDEFSYIFDGHDGEAIKILCKDPSPQLARRLDGFHSVIAMSATLAPAEFYRQMLGFDPDRTDTISLPSPFPREHRKVLVVPRVLTTFRQRGAHYGEIAAIIATTVAARRGNYLALFPSYDFLRAVAEKLETAGADREDTVPPAAFGPSGAVGGTPSPASAAGGQRSFADREDAVPPTTSGYQLRIQQPGMSEADRQELLASLKISEPAKLVLAVQGGVFAEGVDYPGEMLAGVIVVSPALPQVSFERELMRQYYDARYGKGFEYAYIYPGMNRVIQSVGRLIRAETDCGVAVLVCQRFTQPAYRALFPDDWSDGGRERLCCNDLALELRRFWEHTDGGVAG